MLEGLSRDKRSCLWWTFVNCGHKKFYNVGPRCDVYRDCEDGSDEDECHLIVDGGYKYDPPLTDRYQFHEHFKCVIYKCCNKLECLSLAGLFSLV